MYLRVGALLAYQERIVSAPPISARTATSLSSAPFPGIIGGTVVGKLTMIMMAVSHPSEVQ
jgi:hypothetical protein